MRNIKSNSSDDEDQEFLKLLKRFYSIKHRCGRGRDYRHVRFGFESAREAAGYMLADCGPLPPAPEQPARRDGVANGAVRFLTIDRIDGRRGYEPGNMRYATMREQLANRRFKTRCHPLVGAGRACSPSDFRPKGNKKIAKGARDDGAPPCL